MHIATWNINDINKRFAVLRTWLEAAGPEVVCLQELKATKEAFPEDALQKLGYQAVWAGQKSWNGVAILARGEIGPVVTRTSLPGDAADTQARYIEAAVNGVLVGCLYAPNGNPRPGPKYDYKLDWTRRLLAHAQSLLDAEIPVVLAGDFNIVPEARDIYPDQKLGRGCAGAAGSAGALCRTFGARLDRWAADALPGRGPALYLLVAISGSAGKGMPG